MEAEEEVVEIEKKTEGIVKVEEEIIEVEAIFEVKEEVL